MANAGTVMHEIESLERHLDRLIPGVERLNTRISSMESDVRHLAERMGRLKCDEKTVAISEMHRSFDVSMTTIKSDIEAIKKSIDGLESDIGDIESEDKNDKRVADGRVWGIIEKVLLGILSGVGAYIAMKLGFGK